MILIEILYDSVWYPAFLLLMNMFPKLAKAGLNLEVKETIAKYV